MSADGTGERQTKLPNSGGRRPMPRRRMTALWLRVTLLAVLLAAAVTPHPSLALGLPVATPPPAAEVATTTDAAAGEEGNVPAREIGDVRDWLAERATPDALVGLGFVLGLAGFLALQGSQILSAEETGDLYLIDELGQTQALGVGAPGDAPPELLEIELGAPRFEVEGPGRQRQIIWPGLMPFQWHVRPVGSGDRSIGLVLLAVDASGRARRLNTITLKIPVGKVPGLTHRHVWALAGLCGALAVAVGLLDVLTKIGVVNLP